MALVLSASMVLHPERKVAVQAWGYLIHMGFKFVQGKTPQLQSEASIAASTIVINLIFSSRASSSWPGQLCRWISARNTHHGIEDQLRTRSGIRLVQ